MSQTITPGTPASGAARTGGSDRVLGEDEFRAFVREQLARVDVDGASVCLLVPDGTRSCPLPLVLPAVHGALHGRVSRLTVLVALGTHARMSEAALAHHLGYELGALETTYPATTVLNHEWWDAAAFANVGTHRRRAHRRAVGRVAARDRGRPDQPGASSSTTSRSSSAPCSRTRSWGSPAATSTCSPASRGRS